MTKQDFFNKSESERKELIDRAHYYYEIGYALETHRIKDPEIREFIEMCNENYRKYAKSLIIPF